MKRTTVFVLITLILASLSLFSDEKQDLWKKAAAESNMEQKFNLLEEYAQKYPQDENSKVLYYNLTVISYQLKKYTETTKYGELAQAQEGLDNNNKLNVYLYLANAYNVSKTDFDKAIHYAEQLVQLAKTLKGADQASSRYDKNYIVPGLRIQIQVWYSEGKNDAALIQKAADKAIEIYKEYDQSRRSANMILTLANRLYKLKKVNEAIKVMEQVIDPEKPNHRYLGILASWYSKAKNNEKAVEYLEKSYQVRRNVKTAYNIGKLLQSKDVDKAIKYLAEAHMMNPGNTSSEAYKLLRHLFYNVKYKGKPQEEQDSAFQQALQSAKARL